MLSGAAEPERARRAMQAAARHLVDDDAHLVRLLDPPFVDPDHDPGYIKDYPPGVRENGGQYAHAGAWAVMAFAALGEHDLAYRAFTYLSPAHRAAAEGREGRYELEPFVMAGDVYTAPPFVGRGGWSWYTGAAAWMYRAAVEAILGLRIHHDVAVVSPRLPVALAGGGDHAIATARPATRSCARATTRWPASASAIAWRARRSRSSTTAARIACASGRSRKQWRRPRRRRRWPRRFAATLPQRARDVRRWRGGGLAYCALPALHARRALPLDARRQTQRLHGPS